MVDLAGDTDALRILVLTQGNDKVRLARVQQRRGACLRWKFMERKGSASGG
jgi:hypothetical protein